MQDISSSDVQLVLVFVVGRCLSRFVAAPVQVVIVGAPCPVSAVHRHAHAQVQGQVFPGAVVSLFQVFFDGRVVIAQLVVMTHGHEGREDHSGRPSAFSFRIEIVVQPQVDIKSPFLRFLLYGGVLLCFALRHCSQHHPDVHPYGQPLAQADGIRQVAAVQPPFTLEIRVDILVGQPFDGLFGTYQVSHAAVRCRSQHHVPAPLQADFHCSS